MPAGNYAFNSLDAAGTSHLGLHDLADVTIDGHGATFIFSQNQSGILVTASRRLRIAHIRIEYALHTASLGSVRRQDGRKVLVVDAKYPVTGADRVYYVSQYDAAAGAWVQGGARAILPPGAADAAVFIGHQTYTSAAFANLPDGASVAIFHYWYGGAAIRIGDNPGWSQPEDVVLDDVTIYSGPGMGILAYGMKRGFAVLNSSIVLKPDGPSPVSTDYDGIHVLQIGGDLILSHNTISNQGDDGINLNDPVIAVSTVSGNRLTMAPYSRFISRGDELAFFDTEDRFVGLSRVTASVPLSGLNYQVTVDNLPRDFATQGPVRDTALIDSRFNVEDNVISRCNCHGVLIQGPNGLVENNEFHDTSANAIRLLTSAGAFKEGVGAINVIVRNNRIFESGADNSVTMPWSAISAYALVPPNLLSAYPANKDLVIEGNSVTGGRNGCITVASSMSVRILNNLCHSVNSLGRERGSINVLFATGVTLQANQRDGGSSRAIDIDTASTDTITRQAEY